MKNETEKLSKRSGDASYQDLVAKGCLPQAIINYLALLGWSPKGEEEIFSLPQLVELFDVAGISKSPAIFDPLKMRYINSVYIRALDLPTFKALAMPWIQKGVQRTDIDFDIICEMLKPRCEVFEDIPGQLDFIDALPKYDNGLYFNRKMKTDSETGLIALKAALSRLEALQDFSRQGIHDCFFSLIEEMGVKNGYLLWPVRVALSGKPSTPGGGIELCAILGKEESLSRIRQGIEQLERATA